MDSTKKKGGTRRDFLCLTAGAMSAVGAGSALWPLVDSMNPAVDTLAQASVDVDISKIAEGQAVTVVWQGVPVFIRHRTAEEISIARMDDEQELRDPQKDEDRVKKAEWLIVKGVCTHLSCIPLGTKKGQPRGEFGGWFCPCHGSHFDLSGRIRKGPALKNMIVPKYIFVTDTLLRIG